MFLPTEKMCSTLNFLPATDISVPASECLLQNKKGRICKRTEWKTGPSKEEDSTSEDVRVQGSLDASSRPFSSPSACTAFPNHNSFSFSPRENAEVNGI